MTSLERCAAKQARPAPLALRGELFSPESGLLHLHARDMHPQSGRFLSTDSVQPNAPGTQGFNVYSYVANNPTSWADPSGHSVLPQFMLSLEESVGTGLTGLAAGLAKVFLYIHQHRQYRF